VSGHVTVLPPLFINTIDDHVAIVTQLHYNHDNQNHQRYEAAAMPLMTYLHRENQNGHIEMPDQDV
jgi:hypothetical protein